MVTKPTLSRKLILVIDIFPFWFVFFFVVFHHSFSLWPSTFFVCFPPQTIPSLFVILLSDLGKHNLSQIMGTTDSSLDVRSFVEMLSLSSLPLFPPLWGLFLLCRYFHTHTPLVLILDYNISKREKFTQPSKLTIAPFLIPTQVL